MFEVANKLSSFCERLVHDEHLQHQGWAAIMANLEDCTTSSQKLLLKFETSYVNYQHDLEEIKTKLSKYVCARARKTVRRLYTRCRNRDPCRPL